MLCCLLLHTSASAQTERGRFLIGGSADISSTYESNTSRFNLSLAPTFGVFVVKSLAIGARYSFGISGYKAYDASVSKEVSVTAFTTQIGPTIKYYPGKKSLKGVISANGGYVSYAAFIGSKTFNTNGFVAGGSAGIAHFFNQHISLETVLYANVSGFHNQHPVSRFGFSIGIFAFLDKKKQE